MAGTNQVCINRGGGIGEKHLRCFLKTGEVEISLCEPDADKINNLKTKYAIKEDAEDTLRICPYPRKLVQTEC